MNTETDQDQRELATWRAGPWVLKTDHDKLVARLRDQLTKALEALAQHHAEETQTRRPAA